MILTECLDGGMVGGLDGDDDGRMMCIFHIHTHEK